MLCHNAVPTPPHGFQATIRGGRSMGQAQMLGPWIEQYKVQVFQQPLLVREAETILRQPGHQSPQ